MTSPEEPKYWFPAKRYGWGWGPPSAWQGWVVLVAHLVLVVGGIPWIQTSAGTLGYLGYVAVLTLGLVFVCWIKGEPPRLRWGEENHDRNEPR